MNSSRDKMLAVAGLIVVALVIGWMLFADHDGGGSDSGTARDAVPPTSTLRLPPGESVEPAPDYEVPGAVPPEVVDVATRYINAKENAMSHYRDKPRDWLEEVFELMTPEAYSRWSGINNEGNAGAAWHFSHANGVQVRTVVDCETNPQTGPPQPEAMSVRCSVTDVPVYADGSRVPPNKLDFTWLYNGPQQPNVLSMVKIGGKWVIGADATGVA